MENIENTAPRELFTALCSHYSCKEDIFDYINLSEIRTREGGIVKNEVSLLEDDVINMPKDLPAKMPVAFFADVEFTNVEFLNIFEVGGESS